MALELKYQASAALSAALVGFGGSVAIVLEAAKSVGATPEQAASWVMVLCLGVAIASPLLSWRLRMPVITAWSTPGAALIAVSASGVGLSNAVGAFMIAASLMVVTALIRPLGDLVVDTQHHLQDPSWLRALGTETTTSIPRSIKTSAFP